MKINRVSQKDHPKISWKNSFFMNIYYFFCFYRLLASINRLGFFHTAFSDCDGFDDSLTTEQH